MKSVRIGLVGVLGLLGTVDLASAQGSSLGAGASRAVVSASLGQSRFFDMSIFYNELAPYGEWVNHRTYGWVWAPYGITPDWRPYTVGRWVLSDWGWTWVSYEPFGWATYHYGRWFFDPWYGWVWVPGTQWAPAWVAWRFGGGWIGWAPLPPVVETRWDVGIINPTALGASVFRRFAWSFVEVTQFQQPNLRPYIARPIRNINILNLTQDVTRYEFERGRLVNRSAEPRQLERYFGGRPFERFRIQDADRPVGIRNVGPSDREIRLYRPNIRDSGPARMVPDVVRSRVPLPANDELQRRHQRELAELENRLQAERAAMEDRQRREEVRLRRTMTPQQLQEWRDREKGAYEDMVQRERQILQRQHERERAGQVGQGEANQPRFRIGQGQPPMSPR